METRHFVVQYLHLSTYTCYNCVIREHCLTEFGVARIIFLQLPFSKRVKFSTNKPTNISLCLACFTVIFFSQLVCYCCSFLFFSLQVFFVCLYATAKAVVCGVESFLLVYSSLLLQPFLFPTFFSLFLLDNQFFSQGFLS